MKRGWRLSVLLSCAVLPGCAASTLCPASGLANTRCLAGLGDKTAQLELGKAYESGVGVERNLRRAARLYRASAARSIGRTYVYSPPVGGTRGTVVPIRTGPDEQGLAEAKYRLGQLYLAGEGVGRCAERGRLLIDEALREGFRPR